MSSGDVLLSLYELLRLYGIANDADDRNRTHEEGTRLRETAAAGLRALMRDHPFVLELLPTLEQQLETGRIAGVGWALLVSELERKTDATRPGSGSGP